MGEQWRILCSRTELTTRFRGSIFLWHHARVGTGIGVAFKVTMMTGMVCIGLAQGFSRCWVTALAPS